MGVGAVPNSIRDILDVVFRYKTMIAAFCVLVTIIVVFYNFIVPAVYESEAKVLIRRGRENVSVDPSVEGASGAFVQNLENEVNSEVAILKSQQLAEQIVNEIGADEFLLRSGSDSRLRRILAKLRGGASRSLDEKALKKLTEALSVEAERKSNIIMVTYENAEPDLAHTVLDALLRAYEERHIAIHAAKADPTFFEAQVEALKNELTAAETKLDEFRRLYGISSLELQTEALLKEIQDTESMINDAAGKMSASQAQTATLENAVKERDEKVEIARTTGVTNWAADEYKKRLAELRLKESDLSARYEDTYRPLIELRDQITQLEESLSQEGDTHTEVTTGMNENRRQLELELERARAEAEAQEARLKVLNDSLAISKERYAQLSAQKVELDRLQRDVTLAESAYRKYRENLDESKISVALDQRAVSNVSVVQPASKPFEPVRPKKSRNIVLGFLLGLFGGLALAFLLDYLDDSIKTDSDVVRRLGLSVLASIPEDKSISCT